MAQNKTLESLLDEVAPTKEVVLAREQSQLRELYEQVRVDLSDYRSQQSEIQIAVESIQRSRRGFTQETEQRLESIEATLKSTGRAVMKISEAVEELGSRTAIAEDRLVAAEAKLKRAAEIASVHDQALMRLKAQRVTVAQLIGIGVILSLIFSTAAKVHGDFKLSDRVQRIEHLLKR